MSVTQLTGDGNDFVDVTSVFPAGSQANAWNNVAVVANGNSNAIELAAQSTVTIFGNSSAAITLRIQVSQDNSNYYTFTSLSLTTGNFGTTVSLGCLYVRLQASGITTITATISAK